MQLDLVDVVAAEVQRLHKKIIVNEWMLLSSENLTPISFLESGSRPKGKISSDLFRTQVLMLICSQMNTQEKA